MALNTTKQIKSVTYNGTEIPLAGGSSSSGETTSVTFQTDPENLDLWIYLFYIKQLIMNISSITIMSQQKVLLYKMY